MKSYLLRSWSVSWPLALIMFFEFLIGLTDVYIAGRVSKEVQATYGFVIQLYFHCHSQCPHSRYGLGGLKIIYIGQPR